MVCAKCVALWERMAMVRPPSCKKAQVHEHQPLLLCSTRPPLTIEKPSCNAEIDTSKDCSACLPDTVPQNTGELLCRLLCYAAQPSKKATIGQTSYGAIGNKCSNAGKQIYLIYAQEIIADHIIC